MERYESLGLVGEGSYGTVLKCRHRDSGRLVAIKKFMDSDDDKTVKKIALREIKLLRLLRHDNLVNLLEVWKRRRRWYLVFEFVDRTLLEDLEQNPGGLDQNSSRRYLYQILRAAAFCHQQNVIHRDIKPENILISQGGVVKLCDFGFARTVAPASEGVAHTDYVATRWYRAPELLVGDTHYGKPVDVWAIGCLLMEMLTGQPLFPGDSDLDQIHQIVTCFGNLMAHHQELFCRNPVFSGVRLPECSAGVSLKQRFPSVTPAALHLAQSCLEMDPGRRAQCSELLEHLLFTQDSFPIRFLEELNAKIQRAHRENSTLPKINKTPRVEKEEADERNPKGKDRKLPHNLDINTDKVEKTKGKPPTKTSKCNRNISEPLTSTKASNKIQGQAFSSWKKTKEKTLRGGLRKEMEISQKPKPAQRETPKNEKDKTCDGTENNGLNGSENNFIGTVRSFESQQELEKSFSNQKSLRNSQSLTAKHLKVEYESFPTNSVSQVFNPTEASDPSNASKHQDNQTDTNTEESRPDSPNVLPSSPKPSKTEINFNPKLYKKPSCLPLTSSLTPDLNSQSHTVYQEPMVIQKGFLYPMMSKPSQTSTVPSRETLGIKMKQKTMKSNLLTEEATNGLQITKVSPTDFQENPLPAEKHFFSTEMVIESQRTKNTNLREGTSNQTGPQKRVKPSEKENQTEMAHCGPVNTAFIEKSNKEKTPNSSRLEIVVKTFKALNSKPLVGETITKSGAFIDHMRTTSNRTHSPQKDNTKNVVDLKMIPSEFLLSTRNVVCPSVDATSDLNKFELKVPPSSPPPLPPTPTSTPLPFPSTSTGLTPSFSIVGIGGLGAGDSNSHLPGANGLRCIEKHYGSVYSRQAQQFVSNHPPGSSLFQANSTKTPLRTKERNNLRFPPVHQQNQSNPTVPTDKPLK